MSSQRTVAGSLSSQCVQALKARTEGLSPLSKTLDLGVLTPLVPQGLTEMEEVLRTREWMKCYASFLNERSAA